MTKDVEIRRIDTLTHHPAFGGSPMLGDDHPDMRAMQAAIRDAGGPEPIKITEANLIADGRHRARCCELLGLESIPVVIVSDEAVRDIIISSLLGRRHMRKWQVAYSLAPLLENAAENGKRTRSNLPRKVTLLVAETREPRVSANCQCLRAFLELVGVSEDVWERVQSVRKVFAQREDLRQRYEPRLFSGNPEDSISLEGVIKAMGSIIAYDSGKPTPKADRNEHDRLAVDWLRKASAQMKPEWWAQIGERERKKVADEAVEAVTSWPAEVRTALVEALADLDNG